MSVTTTMKAIQDIMRKDVGVDGDAQRISQLIWLLFLKILDAREEERELEEDHYRTVIPDGLRWRTWAADPSGKTGDTLIQFVDNTLFPGLRELDTSRGPMTHVVRAVFTDAYNYMKNGTLLRQVINKLEAGIDYHKSKDRHLLGDMYEKILKDLQSAGNAGEFYTPRAVTQFIVDRLDPKPGERIMDPACGTGGFLANAIDHMRDRYVKTTEDRIKMQGSLHGVEKKPLPHLLCITNMLLHGLDTPNQIRHDNTLSKPLKSYGSQDKVDVILTNPPFGGIEEDGIESNFGSYRTRETADLFLVLIIRLLKENGRAAVVLPDGTLFGDGIKNRIKEKLLTECNLHTIVRLPNGVFNPYTTIKTNLLFFDKTGPTKEIWYYEHPYPEGYKSYSKTKPMRFDEFKPEQAWWDNRVENQFAWKVDFKALKEEMTTKAKPHWDKAEALIRQADILEDEMTVLKDTLKDKSNQDQADIKAKLPTMKAEVDKLRLEARDQKNAGDNLYQTIFNLDSKNPNQEVETLGDPDQLLAEYKAVFQDVSLAREALKQALVSALEESAAAGEARD